MEIVNCGRPKYWHFLSQVVFHTARRQFLQKVIPGVSNQYGASVNVINLQKRGAGVLPVPIDVPRAGTSFSFVRPLVWTRGRE